MLNSRYLVGIFLVLLAATFGWFVLGATIGLRTDQSDTAQRAALAGLWGGAQEQRQPSFSALVPNGASSWRTTELAVWSSRIDVALALDLRRKGLLWYNTYGVDFAGTYRIPNQGRHALLPASGRRRDVRRRWRLRRRPSGERDEQRREALCERARPGVGRRAR